MFACRVPPSPDVMAATYMEYRRSGKSDKADQMCCGLACVSALPAGLLSVSLPDLVAATEMPLPEQALAALTPARLYKPPIAAMSF